MLGSLNHDQIVRFSGFFTFPLNIIGVDNAIPQNFGAGVNGKRSHAFRGRNLDVLGYLAMFDPFQKGLGV